MSIFGKPFITINLLLLLSLSNVLQVQNKCLAKDADTTKKIFDNKDTKSLDKSSTSKNDETQWRKKLNQEQYRVLREKGTERAFTGKYWNCHENGIYKCAACGAELFSSDNKFDSGSGWPSFTNPSVNKNITTSKDNSYGMERVEVLCSQCKSHLGHVFNDGPAPSGKRYCINSVCLDLSKNTQKNNSKKENKDLKNMEPKKIMSEADLPVYSAKEDEKELKSGKDVAYFAAGCFWGVEDAFKNIKGVLGTTVGYTGGHTDYPSYRDVCGHGTGHAEAVRIVFDPKIISYKQLVSDFLDMHDPTTLNRQGPDVGDQYRSAIFYTNKDQLNIAKEVLNNKQTKMTKKIVTTFESLKTFYSAEDYHQDYFAKHPGHGCHIPSKH